ncbi:Alpha/Beta hydrolase protein [Leucosporidium creatinivorum]|uniref:Alpha/Beta hydrolase protein n=1 Tax=Leucosporidium creatinivorum TaxID=106004 RepID=A0A1Y2DFW7_9BASI|nr:Alpha/Beta hydrolase protein [Leucosporidium creatinivorum]
MSLKLDLEKATPPSPPPGKPRSRFYLLPCLLFAALLSQLSSIDRAPRIELGKWIRASSGRLPAIPLAPGVSWTPCPDVTDTLCSYLTVPLDYTNPNPAETVSLALRMLPSSAPPSEQLGYLFINPGGPGGSGHNFVVRAGRKLSTILQGRYHILSWDPRSVNLTSPSLDCFPTSGDAARFARDVEHLGLIHDYATAYSEQTLAAELAWTARYDSFALSLDAACQSSGEESRNMLSSSSTATVVRDMKRILEALGEKKLSYMGFSYGTILGATFSAMFPELVERVWLDGVSDSVAYTNNFWDWGRAGMNDTQKTYDGFLSSCASSGPLGCGLAQENSTAKGIGSRVQTLIDQLRETPLPVGRSKVGPGVVTASQVQYAIFQSLYSPKTWPQLASALASLEQGNGTALYEIANVSNDELDRAKDPLDNVFHRRMGSGMDATAAIMCSDTSSSTLNDTSLSTLHSYMLELDALSPTGNIWAMWVSQCRRWTAKAREVYRGPWTRKEGLRKPAYPIVFFSQTADPVTPLVSARKMARGFGKDSSRVVVQDGFGHCSLAHPSLCTALAARAYFLNGTLPSAEGEEKHCKSDEGFLFPHPGAEVELQAEGDDRELVELKMAMWELAEEARGMKLGMGWGR